MAVCWLSARTCRGGACPARGRASVYPEPRRARLFVLARDSSLATRHCSSRSMVGHVGEGLRVRVISLGTTAGLACGRKLEEPGTDGKFPPIQKICNHFEQK